jgi:hypothetical protein
MIDKDTDVPRELSSLIYAYLNLSFSFIFLQVSPASSCWNRWRKHFAIAAEIGS